MKAEITKKCSNCFQVKLVTEFYRKLKSYQSRCKQCNAEVCSGYKLNKSLKRLEAAHKKYWAMVDDLKAGAE